MKTGVFVALLRGVNIGGKHCLPMKDLAEMFRKAKCVDVATFIQSGNVILSAPSKSVAGICANVTEQIAEHFGFPAPMVYRSLPQMTQVLQSNPFLVQHGESALHVSFLADRPAAERIALLDPQRSLPDSFAVIGCEIHLHLPNGAGKSKLTNAYFDSKLKTFGTARNWKTVTALHKLMTAVRVN